MSSRLRLKISFIFCRIASQHQHVVYSQIMQINQSVFSLIDVKATTNQMGNRIHIILVHNRCANRLSSWSFSNHYFLKNPICTLFKHMLTTVIGNINKSRIKLRKHIQMIIQRLNALTLQRWQYFKRNQCLIGIINVVNYPHVVVIL